MILRSKAALKRKACVNRSGCACKLIFTTTPTAASSGRRAPFAMLCFPGRSLELLWTVAALAEPSFVVSSARQSSSVAGCPSRREKNLCRKTVLICSNAWEVYQPSLSYSNLSLFDLKKVRYERHNFRAMHLDSRSCPSTYDPQCRKFETLPSPSSKSYRQIYAIIF